MGAAGDRLHALDALRAFALILGIFFHGAAGYIENFPVTLWPMREPPSTALAAFFFVSHMFRMSLFFLLAGFFGRMMLERRGTRAFVRDRAKRILLPLAVGAFSLASVAGLLALPVPAGAGVREAVLVVALSPVLPVGQALLLALVSRALLTVGYLAAATAAAREVWATGRSESRN